MYMKHTYTLIELKGKTYIKLYIYYIRILCHVHDQNAPPTDDEVIFRIASRLNQPDHLFREGGKSGPD